MTHLPPIEEIVKHFASSVGAKDILDKRAVLYDYVIRHSYNGKFYGERRKLNQLRDVEEFLRGMYKYCIVQGNK